MDKSEGVTSAATLAPSDKEIDSRLRGLRFYLDLQALGLPTTLEAIESGNFARFEDPDTLAGAIVERTHPELRKELRRAAPSSPVPQRLAEDHVQQICNSRMWLPISRAILENRLSHLHMLTRQAAAKMRDQAEHSTSGEALTDIKLRIDAAVDRWTDWFTSTYVGTLNAKSLTCLVLGNDKPDGLARIFETINSTGMSLSVFDLLVARLGAWKEEGKNVNLRSKVLEAVRPELLRAFDDEKSLGGAATQQLPRGLALRAKLELKKGEILRAPRNQFQPHLAGVGTRVDRSLTSIRDVMCVLDESWLPFKDLLTLSYALLEDDDSDKQRQKKVALLWVACLLEDWTSETNTKTQRWYSTIQTSIGGAADRVIERVQKEFPSFEDVLAAGSKSSAIFKTLMAFNLARSGNDWSGARREPGATLEDHHIFPRDWITNNKAATPDKQQWITVRDSVLNRVFVTKAANGSAKAQVPPIYLAQLTLSERRVLQIPDSFMGPLPVPIPFDRLSDYLKDRYDLMRRDFIEGVSGSLR